MSALKMERQARSKVRRASEDLTVPGFHEWWKNDQKTSASLVNALVISRLDHCNSLLIGLPHYELQKLQKVFNTAARIVTTRTRPDAHITPVL